MKVERVETFVVRQKLVTPFYFSQWEYDERKVCLVKITAADGTYGWGEGYGPAAVVQAGIGYLTPQVVGRDPLHEATIWQEMYRRSLDYGRRGVLLASLSAIDIALWDLKGKLLGQPISVLLGGRRRDRVHVPDHAGTVQSAAKPSSQECERPGHGMRLPLGFRQKPANGGRGIGLWQRIQRERRCLH